MSKNISQRFSTLASDPLRGFKFYASFTPVGQDTALFSSKIKDSNSAPANGVSTGFFGGFTQIGGLQVQVQDIPYREGGFNVTAHHMPGLVSFPPVVFQRGVLYGNDQAMTWLRGLIEVASGKAPGLNGNPNGIAKDFRVNVEIFAADHPNTADKLVPRIGWKLHNAWLTSLNYTDLSSVANEVLFETMTLVHEGMEVFFTDANENPVVGTPTQINTGV